MTRRMKIFPLKILSDFKVITEDLNIIFDCDLKSGKPNISLYTLY